MTADPYSVHKPEMMSRRERKKRETRMRILDAAIALMSERGYDAVKVEEIARAADIANATFFLHFPTKASLVAAFNEQVTAKIAGRLEGLAFGAVEKLEVLRAIVLDEWGRHGDFLRKLVSDAAAQDGGFLETSETLTALVAEIVREGQDAGEFAADFDAGLVAATLVGAWRRSTLEWARTGDAARARRANREALDLILRGLSL